LNGTTQATATFDASQLPAGQYNVIASYPGDGNYGASTSASVPLNLVATFTVANRGISSQTVAAGNTASYINDIGVMPFFGFSSTVTVACTVPAQATTCSVSPASYSLASGPGVGTLSVTTTARSTAGVGTITDRSPSNWLSWRGLAVAVFFSAILLASKPRRQRFMGAPAFSLLILVSIGIGLAGCGSGSGGGGGSPPQTGTAAGSYTVTVTGTSGTVTETTTLTLIVQ